MYAKINLIYKSLGTRQPITKAVIVILTGWDRIYYIVAGRLFSYTAM